jgi:hypothetical protein
MAPGERPLFARLRHSDDVSCRRKADLSRAFERRGSTLSEGFDSGPRVGFPSEYVPHLHIVDALDLDGPAGFAVELALYQVVGAAGNLDGPAFAVRFHTASQIQRLGPRDHR